MAEPMTVDSCDPNDWPVVAWVFIGMARGGHVSIVEAQPEAALPFDVQGRLVFDDRPENGPGPVTP